jgi:hypothetical protein
VYSYSNLICDLVEGFRSGVIKKIPEPKIRMLFKTSSKKSSFFQHLDPINETKHEFLSGQRVLRA